MKMKNSCSRILSMLIVGLMMLTALVSCNQDYRSENILAAKAMTLTITMVKEEGTTDEGIKLVENAINQITESKYNTHIVLQMFTPEEYSKNVIEMSEKLYVSGAGNGSTTYSSSKIVIDDTEAEIRISSNGDYNYIDEKGRAHAIYPTLTDTQLDIVFIDSVDTYKTLASGAGSIYNRTPFISDLGTLVSESDEPVTKYINSTILGVARKAAGMFGAIPNNNYFGEYSYLVINKKYFDELNYDIANISDFASLKNYISDIVEKEEYKEVLPLYNYTGFNWQTYYDFDTPLLLAPATSYDFSTKTSLTSVFSTQFFVNSMESLYNITKNAPDRMYIEANEVDFTKNFAIAMVNGGPDYEKGDFDFDEDGTEDYYVINTARPTVDNKMFESMFAVSTFSVNQERAYQILAMLQTNEEIVNLLAYGIENVHYEKNLSGVVSFIDAKTEDGKDASYNVSYNKVGNTFLCYPNEKMDEDTLAHARNNWELAKKHNEKLIVSPYCGFSVSDTKLSDYIYYGESQNKFVEKQDGTGVVVVDGNGKEVIEKGKSKNYIYTALMVRRFEDYCAEFMPKMYDFDKAEEFGSYTEYAKVLAAEFEKSEIYCYVTNNNIEAISIDFYGNSVSPQGQYITFFDTTYGSAQ